MRAWSFGCLCLLVTLSCDTSTESGGTGDVTVSPDSLLGDDTEGGADGPDATSSDGSEEVTEEPDIHVEGPPASLETALTDPTRDSICPDLDGEDLVWYEAKPIPAMRVEGQETDCLACPGCGQCEWNLRHKRVSGGAETLIAVEQYAQTAPQVGDGLVTWLHSDGTAGVFELETGALHTVKAPTNSYFNWAPTPSQGALWWYGYNYVTGGSGIHVTDIDSGATEMKVQANIYENWSTPNGTLNSVTRSQPFSLAGGGATWTDWGNSSQLVRRWSAGSSAAEIAWEDPTRDFTAAVGLDDGRLITKSYDRALGCSEMACQPEIRLHDGKSVKELTGKGHPTLYGRPVVAGGRVFWLDFRDGPYAIWSRRLDDLATGPERLSSEEAVLGAAAPVAASESHLAWMDRRDGIWRIYVKALAR